MNLGFSTKTISMNVQPRRLQILTSLVSLCLGLLLSTSAAAAQDEALYPSFLFDLSYGLTTLKSKAVASNDTGTSLAYGLGGFAGASRNIEFNLGFETDTTAFLLNDSKVVYDWQDTKLNYHLGYFYAGLIFSRLNWKLNAAGVDLVDAAGSGYGGSLGFYSPIGKSSTIRVDISTVNIATMKNALATEVSIPSRLDIDIGAAVELGWKWLDFNFGYRMRTLSVKTDKAYSDSESSTYIGLRFSTTR